MRIKTLIILLLAVLLSTPAYADRHGDGWRKEMRDFKLRFLAQEMDLRQDQQKQFITTYNQMTEETQAVMQQTRNVMQRVEKMSNPTDADYEAACDALLKAHEQDLSIEKKYEERFKTFLSPKQIYLMKEAERKFRDRLREMRRNGPPRND